VPFDEEGALRSLRAVEYVGMALLNSGRIAPRLAQARARRALERSEVLSCAETLIADLSQEDRLRVELSQALVREPALLLVDEPPMLRSPSRRMAVHRLLRSLADRHRAVILVSESLELLQGVPRMMSIGGGELREVDRPGEVVRLPVGEGRRTR
jgi:energy-coupling factor transporter ATP-binding protein EcfA2